MAWAFAASGLAWCACAGPIETWPAPGFAYARACLLMGLVVFPASMCAAIPIFRKWVR